MDSFNGKQGLEIEMFIKDEELEKRHDEAYSIFQDEINSRTYFDDGKPEYPTEPHNNLRDLEREVRNYLSNVLDICRNRGWYLNLIGSDPYSIDFASAHVHNSITDPPIKKAIFSMRRRLYNIQPFIALLSQNSPLSNSQITYCKDSRLGYSVWSRFTEYDTTNPSHYLSLASGELGHTHNQTLEVRIPSSSILEQVFANVVIIKTFIQLKDTPILPIAQCKENFFKVIRYGGEALIPLLKPTGIGYLGFKGKKVYVKISELFGLLLKDDNVQDYLKESLKELSPSLRSRVLEFFNDISKGYTMSDFILETYFHNQNKESFTNILNNAIQNSLKGESYKEILDTPDRPFFPIIEKNISLEELEEMLKKNNFDFKIDYDTEQIERILSCRDRISIRKSLALRFLLRELIRHHKMIGKYTKDVIKYAIENELMTNDGKEGRLLSAVYQEARERGLI